MLDHPERRQSFAIVVAAAVSWAMRDFSFREMNAAAESLGLPASLLLAFVLIVFLVLFSLVIFFVFAAAATAAGRLFLGGQGTFGEVRTAVAWGLVPQIWALLYRIPAIFFWPEAMAALGGNEQRIRAGRERSIDLTFVEPTASFVILALLELLTLFAYLAVGGSTLAEAQRFSTARGLANLLVAVVLPFAIVAIIAAAAWLAIATT